MTAPMHVLLLTVDAWRADFVDTFEGVPLLPSLARLADHTVRFDRAYANGPWTTPGLVSLFTGRSPLQHGVHFPWSTPPVGTPALAAAFQAAGYRAPNLCYLNGVENYLNLGYDPAETPARPTGPDDDRVLQAALAAGATGAPCFWWFHDKWVHLPYTGDAASRALFGVEPVPAALADTVAGQFVLTRAEHPLDPAHTDAIRRLYAANVRAFDARLARLLDALEALDLLDRTVIVLTSDHGEELMERGHVGHASTAEHAHVFEEVLRIPLLVYDPRVTAPRRVQARVQQRDLFTTLQTLVGLPAPTGGGVDLTPCILGSGEPAVDPARLFAFHSARRGYRTPPAEAGEQVVGLSDGHLKLVDARFDGVFDPVLYDLDRDPGERSPLRDRAQLAAWLQRLAEAIASGV